MSKKKKRRGEPTVPREQSDYYESLLEQLEFLIDDCDSYDRGKFNRSKQISMTIRNLVVTTGSSTSVLTHLKRRESMKFCSTASFPKNAVFYLGMVFPISVTKKDGSITHIYLPFLNSNKSVLKKWVPFERWWHQKVIIHNDLTFSRYNMIDYMANQDGGGHVDSDVVEKYYKISKGTESMFYATDKPLDIDPYQKGEPFKYLHFALVRQIAHELILSIRKEFKLKISYNPTNFYNQGNKRIGNPTDILVVQGDKIEYEE